MLSHSTKMPSGIRFLYWLHGFSTFSYAVLFSSLALYLTNKLHFSQDTSNSVVGLFLAFNFALHLLCGYVGGRLLSFRFLFVVALLFQIVGIFILLSDSSFYLGLSFFLIGCGFESTCLNCMLTQQFSAEDVRRESAFYVLYWAMNIGFFMGFIASGLFDLLDNYKSLFYITNLFNIITLVLVFFAWKHIKDKDTPLRSMSVKNKVRTQFIGLFLIVSLLPLLLIGLHKARLANNLVLGLGIIVLLFILAFAVLGRNQIEKNKIYAYLILTVSSIVFWMLFYVGPMGVMHFLKYNVAFSVLDYKIPPQWIMNLNAIFVISGTPVWAYILKKLRENGLKITISKQFTSALIAIALSFYFLSIGIYCSANSGLCSGLWIVLHFFAQAFGEILIAPVGLAMVGKLAPVKLQGIMMGMWMMVSGVAASLSNYFSNNMANSVSVDPLITNTNYLDVFNQLGMFALIGAVILFLFSSKIDFFTQEKIQAVEEILACS